MKHDLQENSWKPSWKLLSRETISWSPQFKEAAYRDEQSKGEAKQSCKTQTLLSTSLSPKACKKWEKKVLSVAISLLPRPWPCQKSLQGT